MHVKQRSLGAHSILAGNEKTDSHHDELEPFTEFAAQAQTIEGVDEGIR
jgi:hypothetical protein